MSKNNPVNPSYDSSSDSPSNEKDVYTTTAPIPNPGEHRAHVEGVDQAEESPRKWWHSIKEPGSAAQIVCGAVVAIGIGMAVNATVDTVPAAALAIVGIPGRLWLRALTAVVLPLIITAMILAVQRLRDMTRGGSVLARYTISYYVITTIIAIAHSILMTGLVWRNQWTEVDAASLAVAASDAATVSERSSYTIHEVIVSMFDSFIPNNLVNALATNSLLAVLVSAVVVGYLIEGGEEKSSLLRATKEVDRIITIVITFLIKLAPIGVFFLILSNIMRLNIAEVGRNLGILIGAALTGMFFHLFVVLPIIFWAVTRENPYSYWFKCAPAWITAWGSASSAATMPVTMRQVLARGNPVTIAKFTVPLGCLINMDGTAIYFPVSVVFMAATQGISLNPGEYVIVVLLATIASIGATPIPSASLVLIVMICGSVNVPITGMYAVIVAIDWFLDRFRTALNVSSDLFAAKVIAKLTKIEDHEEEARNGDDEAGIIRDAVDSYQRGDVRG